jgi:hypothetical protein
MLKLVSLRLETQLHTFVYIIKVLALAGQEARRFLEQLCDCQLLKNDFVPLSISQHVSTRVWSQPDESSQYHSIQFLFKI